MKGAKARFMENLKRFRLERGMTQYDLGRKCGFKGLKSGGAKISSYESGRYTPSFATIDAIAKALNVRVPELFE